MCIVCFNNIKKKSSRQQNVFMCVRLLERLTAVGNRWPDHATPSTRERLALTSPTSGGRSVGIVRLQTTAMEFS
jgi:hypothetical protein